jgi:hypothetical protein
MAMKLEQDDLEMLRRHLLQLGPDYCGASEVIRAFLSGHGYGVSPERARDAAVEFGRRGCSLASMEAALADVSAAN